MSMEGKKDGEGAEFDELVAAVRDLLEVDGESDASEDDTSVVVERTPEEAAALARRRAKFVAEHGEEENDGELDHEVVQGSGLSARFMPKK